MVLDIGNLPDDQPISKQQLVSIVSRFEEELKYLKEQNRLLRQALFGRKSEKPIVEDRFQMPLFDTPQAEQVTKAPADDNKQVPVTSHSRKKRGRKPLPENLPRVDVIHDLNETEKMCACGHEMSRIGRDECEKLDYIPAKIQVLRHIRYKYACKNCEGVESDGPTVKIAAGPTQLIPKSNATAGLLAHIFISKYADALPLYRQQKMFARLGLDLSRSTMANWGIEAAERCRPLVDLFRKEIRSGPLINVDETTLQVLKEPGRRNASKSYMWLFRGGEPDTPAVVYQYDPSRSGQVAEDFIGDFQGYVQSDAFSGYNRFERKSGIRLMGCWAHARRRFVEVAKVNKKIRSKRKTPKGLAEEALEFIRQLYRIEKQARELNLSSDQILQLRQDEAVPILGQFKKWLDEKAPVVPPKSLLGKAIAYSLDNWQRLIVYVENGLLKPDNNAAENAIRPFAIGRKNWLFAGHPRGAKAAETFFSLIETAKANRLEPYAYLRYLFENLPLVESRNGYRSLMPQHLTTKDIA